MRSRRAPFEPPPIRSWSRTGSVSRPADPTEQRHREQLITKRAITLLAGLVLAAGIVGSFISRQGLRASQNKNSAPAVVASKPAPRNARDSSGSRSAGTARASKPGESGPDDVGNPEFSARQTLRGPVRSLWESADMPKPWRW